MMDSINTVIVSGILDRDPALRTRDDGTALCSGSLRLEQTGAGGVVFTTYLPFEAYSKLAEAVVERHAGDVVLLQGKVFWRKYQTKAGQEKSGLALLVQKCGLLVPAPVAA